MDPHEQFCHNPACWAYGRRGEGHIVSHSQRERRCRCKRCDQTFAATKGTALYRAHQPHDLVVRVVTFLAHGCPVQAIVAAFGWDERTVARYQAEAGAQCRRVHEHLVQAGRVEAGQVQADELRVRLVGGVVWVATALTVASRLWLGGAVSAHRDRPLIRRLLERVRACGPTAAVLLCVDGLSSYVSQARRVFRERVPTGRPDRPGHQAVRQAPGRRGGAPGRAGGGRRRAGAAGGDAGHRRGGHQHRLHRAAQRHLPCPSRRPGATHQGGGTASGDAGGGDVAGRRRLQLLLAARQPPATARRRRPTGREVA